MPLQLAVMEKDVDINKVVRQHTEMENFFSGGFVVKGKNSAPQQPEQEDNAAAAEAAGELEKIADEVQLGEASITNRRS